MVLICKITLSAYCKSVTMLKGSVKSINTMRIAYNSDF